MTCPYCNTEITYQTANCPSCHAPLPDSMPGAPVPPAYPTQQQQPVTPQYPQQPAPPQYQQPYGQQGGQPNYYNQPPQNPPPYNQQPYYPQPYNPYYYQPQPQPRSAPMGLGIASIILAIFIPLFGLGCGIAGLAIYNEDNKKGLNPPSSYKVLNIVGLVLTGLRFLLYIGLFVFSMLAALWSETGGSYYGM